MDATTTRTQADDCATCPHSFHGLPCRRYIYPDPTHPYAPGQCKCDGPLASNQEDDQ